jgi:large subunit ribosomal protein L19
MTTTTAKAPAFDQQRLLESLTASQLKKDVPPIAVGDTVNVHFRIVEGDKERTQVFQGVVISLKGGGIDRMCTVRKVVDEIGVERKFPVNSPMVAKFEILRSGDARRAKLYYLRDRMGKAQRLRDKRRGVAEKAEAIAANNAAVAASNAAAAANTPADAPAKGGGKAPAKAGGKAPAKKG